MTELLFTNFTTENAECSVDVHITVLIMAEQIGHDAMVGDAEIPCNVIVPVRLLAAFHLYWKNIY